VKQVYQKYKPYLNLLLAILFVSNAFYNWLLVFEISNGRILIRALAYSWFGIASAINAYNNFIKRSKNLKEI